MESGWMGLGDGLREREALLRSAVKWTAIGQNLERGMKLYV